MATDFTPVPDTRAVGQGNPPQDVDNISDELAAMGGNFNVLNANWAGGADPTGSGDSWPAINAALAAGQAFLPPVNPATGLQAVYKITAPLVIPNGGQMSGLVRSFGVPTGNYGNAGLPLTGAIIQPAASFSGATVISLGNAPASQAGGQSIYRITIDGSHLPSSSAVAGIQAIGWVAGVTLREVLIWSGPSFGQMLGPGIDAHADGSGHAPDFWDVAFCKVSGINGIGVNFAGLADSYILNSEATGNGGDNWKITNGNNSRYANCKGEGSNTGLGWNLIGNSGFTGTVYLNGCTSASDGGGGFAVSGSGTGLYRLNGVNATDTTPYTFSGSNTVQFASSPAIVPGDIGLLGMSFDPALMQGTGDGLTAGQPQLIRIPVRENLLASKVRVFIVAGGTCTSGQCFAGLYSPAGTKLGGSADQASAWQAASIVPVDATLTGGPFLISPPFVWAVVVWNGTSTTFGRSFNSSGANANGNLAASVARFAHNGSTQTSLPSSITPGSNVIDQHTLFAALL